MNAHMLFLVDDLVNMVDLNVQSVARARTSANVPESHPHQEPKCT